MVAIGGSTGILGSFQELGTSFSTGAPGETQKENKAHTSKKMRRIYEKPLQARATSPKKTGLPALPSGFQHPEHPGGSGQTESERTGSYPETAPKASGSYLSIPRAPWQKKHLDPIQYVMNLTGFDATTQGQGLSPFGNGCESNHSRESHCEKLPNGKSEKMTVSNRLTTTKNLHPLVLQLSKCAPKHGSSELNKRCHPLRLTWKILRLYSHQWTSLAPFEGAFSKAIVEENCL